VVDVINDPVHMIDRCEVVEVEEIWEEDMVVVDLAMEEVVMATIMRMNMMEDGYGGGNNYGGGNGYGQGGYDDYGDNSWYDDGGYGGNSYDDYGGNEDELTGYVVHMRGLPFKATDDEIRQFFSPLVTTRVIREYARDGRITGEANVEFASEQDAQAAMQRDKEHLQSRYIELFYRGQGGSEGGKHSGYGGGPKPLMGRNMMRGGGGGRRGAGPMRRGRGRGGYGGGRW